MPKKTKTVYSEQKCEDCIHFDLAVDNKRCAEKCKKQVTMSRYRPNETAALIERADSEPDFKKKLKDAYESLDKEE